MKHFEQIYTRDTQGFHITLSIGYEDSHPGDYFDNSVDDIAEICRKIDNGTYTWFVARVEAYKAGILLATDYLGANLYENPKDFINDCYFEDMVDNVVNEATATLEKLYDTRDEVMA
jgi:hypothetical protein